MRTAALVHGRESRRLFSCCARGPFDVGTSNHFRLLTRVSLRLSTDMYLGGEEQHQATSFGCVLTCDKLELILLAEIQGQGCKSARLLLPAKKDALAASFQQRRRDGRTVTRAVGLMACAVTYRS